MAFGYESVVHYAREQKITTDGRLHGRICAGVAFCSQKNFVITHFSVISKIALIRYGAD
jgi:hypothetical protein